MKTQAMKHGRGLRLGDLQLRIMRILWQRGEATVAEVMEDLGRAQLAYTTVATMLRKMEARGLVRHRVEGRTFIYKPQVAEEQVSRKMTDHLLDRLFQGSLSGMISHLLSTREVTESELAELERLIAERKRGR
jgi:predicted transcriptional regulator